MEIAANQETVEPVKEVTFHLQCQHVIEHKDENGKVYAEDVYLMCVWSEKPEEQSYSKATPWGEFRFYVSNPNVLGHYKPGKKYLFNSSEKPAEPTLI